MKRHSILWPLATAAVLAAILSGCSSNSGSGTALNGGASNSAASASRGQTQPEPAAGSQSTTGSSGSSVAPKPGGNSPAGNSPGSPKPVVPNPVAPSKPATPKEKFNSAETEMNMTPAAPSTGGWGKSDLSPAQLAAKIDKRFSTLRQAGFDSVINLIRTGGGKGYVKAEGKILSPSQFKIETEGWQGKHPVKITSIGNQSRIWTDYDLQMGVGSKKDTLEPLKSSPVSPGSAYLSKWLNEMPQYVLGWYPRQSPMYTPLVKTLLNPSQHFKVTSEKRVTTYNGKIISDYRILAVRDADSPGGKGYAQIELVVDGGMFLPVTVRTRFRTPKGETGDLMWSGRWYPQKVKSSDVKLPKLIR